MTARAATEKTDVKSLGHPRLEALMAALGQPRFRAGQLFGWLHHRRVESFAEMSDLPAALRDRLDEACYITTLACLRRQSDGQAEKFLFELPDKNTVETVLLTHDYGRSLCVSSQVGCAMGCRFCASAIGGKARDLAPSELLEQIYAVTRLTGRKVDSVVMMGMGEPLDNLENVLRFLELVRDPAGLGLSHRHVSLSTCGLVDKINELARHKLQLTLSVSLHAADDETRDALMPVNRRWPIADLLGSCKEYFRATGRRVSYEYALIAGINDGAAQARLLAGLLRGQEGCHVNLIPINPVEGAGFSRGGRREAERFRDLLAAAGFSATIRRELGGGIDAACGQLRQNQQKGGDGHVADG